MHTYVQDRKRFDLKAKDRQRLNKLLPNWKPRWVRIYDNGGLTYDRYTVVFTGNFPDRNGQCHIVAMSDSPFHPQGYCQHEDYPEVIDRPRYSHLGKRIDFDDLPHDCKRVVLSDYMYLWDLKPFDRKEQTDGHMSESYVTGKILNEGGF